MAAVVLATACTSGLDDADVADTEPVGDIPDATSVDDNFTTLPPVSELESSPGSPDAAVGELAADQTPGSGPAAGPVTRPGTGLEFDACPGGRCTTVPVLIDPDQAELGTIDIAVRVIHSADPEQRRGYLFVDPGGSGAGYVAGPFLERVPGPLLEAFDIVGFDRRGTGESEPGLTCGGREIVRRLTDQVSGAVDAPDEVAALDELVARCADATGPAAAYLGTEFVAHDVEAIRRALGAEQIAYYGMSYGSVTAVHYASAYPGSVRSMVVDGASNPVDDAETPVQRVEAQLYQAVGVEEQLGRALVACGDPSCPLYNDGDPVGAYLAAVEKIGLVEEIRPDTPNAGLMGIISTLYAEWTWPRLWSELNDLLERDDPRDLARFSDFLASDSDIREVEWIRCLDQQSLLPQLDRATQLADAVAFIEERDLRMPLLAAAVVDDDQVSLCPFMDRLSPGPLDVPFDGGDVPILVIGNPSDLAASFLESVELVDDTLSNGYLLEADHPSHTVYLGGNECVVEIVNRVLIDLVYPDERTVVCDRI